LGRLITFDSGADTGWSNWEAGRLVSCGLTHPRDYPEVPYLIGLAWDGLDLVVENPQDYGSNRQVDPNNLITLGNRAGQIVGVYRALYALMGKPLTWELVLPAKWKGQVPKPIHHDRHLPKLDAREKTVLQAALKGVAKGKHHDVKDAVCLGLWRLHR
jgi:hypothetical protein